MAIGSVAFATGTGAGVAILLIDVTAILGDRRERPWIYFDAIKCLGLIIVLLLLLLIFFQKPSIATVYKWSESR